VAAGGGSEQCVCDLTEKRWVRHEHAQVHIDWRYDARLQLELACAWRERARERLRGVRTVTCVSNWNALERRVHV
jgi:hypothetical protein